MDVRSLRYFIETVKHRSFTRAAAALDVTQSTVSKMIRQLEDELGEPLLVRDARPLALTDTGRVVYERGQEVLGAMQRLSTEVRKTQSVDHGSLDVGMPPMINLLFTQVLKTFRARHPHIQLTLHEDTGQEIERQIAAGDLEIGMSILPTDPGLDLVATEIARHAVWALGSPGAMGSTHGDIKLDALRQRALVLLNDDFALTRRLRAEFQRAGFTPRIAAQSGQWDWTVSMAHAGMGIALLPEPFIRRINPEGLVLARVTAPDIYWQVAHVWNGRHMSHAAQAWLDVCETELGGKWL